MGILEDVDTDDLWGKSRIAKLMQQKKAMEDKKKMEQMGWHRYVERGTCASCERTVEQVYATIIDICGKCRDTYFQAWADKKIYFKMIVPKPNIDWATGKVGVFRCQACNSKKAMLYQVNIKVCIKCMNDIGRRDQRENKASDQQKRGELIQKNKVVQSESR